MRQFKLIGPLSRTPVGKFTEFADGSMLLELEDDTPAVFTKDQAQAFKERTARLLFKFEEVPDADL